MAPGARVPPQTLPGRPGGGSPCGKGELGSWEPRELGRARLQGHRCSVCFPCCPRATPGPQPRVHVRSLLHSARGSGAFYVADVASVLSRAFSPGVPGLQSRPLVTCLLCGPLCGPSPWTRVGLRQQKGMKASRRGKALLLPFCSQGVLPWGGQRPCMGLGLPLHCGQEPTLAVWADCRPQHCVSAPKGGHWRHLPDLTEAMCTRCRNAAWSRHAGHPGAPAAPRTGLCSTPHGPSPPASWHKPAFQELWSQLRPRKLQTSPLEKAVAPTCAACTPSS